MREQLEIMAFAGDVHVDLVEGRKVVYLMPYYLAEQRVTKNLRLLRGAQMKPIVGGEIDALILRTEARTGISLSDTQ